MASAISPAYTKIRYHVGAHRHVMTLPCLPSGSLTPGSRPDVLGKDGSPIDWGAALTAFLALAKTFVNATAGFDIAEFWSKPTPTSPAVFIDAINVTVAGTGGGGTLVAGEGVLTLRTAHKGGLKLYIMEVDDPENLKIPAPFTGSAQITALANYLCGNTGWIVGRNNDYPIVALNYTTKINDVLRDKYLIGG